MQSATISMRALGAAAALLGFAVVAPAARAGEAGEARVTPALETVRGVWLEESGRGAIEITSCGEGICGRLVWIKADDGKAPPKPVRRGRAPAEPEVACGQQIIGDVKPVEPGTWDGGWIYSPELHARFDVEVKPIDHDSLQVTGYDGSKDASQRMVWTRAPSDITRCEPKPGLETAAAVTAGHEAGEVGAKDGSAVAVAASGASAVAAAHVSASRSHAKAADRRRVREHAEAPRKKVHVAVEHRHRVRCNVKVPFADVSFRCSSKASRILARLF